MNKRYVRVFSSLPPSGPCRDAVENALARASCRTVRGTCWLVMAFQAVLLLFLLLLPERHPPALRSRYIGLYLAPLPMALAALFSCSAALKRPKLPPRRYYFLEALYALFLCLWGGSVTLLDQHNGSDLNVFSYVTLSVAASTVLPPIHRVVVFVSDLLFFCLLLPLAPGVTDLSGSLVHAFFIFLLALLISSTLYRSKALALRDKVIIQEQYDVIWRQNERLRQIALTDSLTGMNNRRFLEKAVSESRFSGKTGIAGMMVDIDHFKHYNDTYGHVRGDLCLQSLARTLQGFLKGRDGFAVRYGGEEFFLCLFGCPYEAALTSAELLRTAVETAGFPSLDGSMTVSIGVYAQERWPKDGLPEIICRADKALYQAKQKGRNRVEYYDPTVTAPDSEYCVI